jgi:uracil-DNA glycosylase
VITTPNGHEIVLSVPERPYYGENKFTVDPLAEPPKGVSEQASGIRERLLRLPPVAFLVGADARIPEVVCGEGEIGLICIGQDPTAHKAKTREHLTQVFNWNRGVQIRNYIARLCEPLNMDVNMNVYATNLVKCFCIAPPSSYLRDTQIAAVMKREWLPLLRREVACFPVAKVVTLGEPVYRLLCASESPVPLRARWGHSRPRVRHGEMSYVRDTESELGRAFFPFPHQQNASGEFYRTSFQDYLRVLRTAQIAP